MITQPLIAVAYCPEGTTVSEYSRHVAGLIANKVGTGDWLFQLDRGVPSGKLIVLASLVLASAAESTIVVTLAGADAAGNVQQFEITTRDSSGAALDTGLMVGVTTIPDLD